MLKEFGKTILEISESESDIEQTSPRMVRA